VIEREELAGWLRLALTPGIGNTGARRLLSAFGLPHRLFQQPAPSLREVATPDQVSALTREPAGFQEQLAAAWQWLNATAAAPRRVVTLADADYPQGLLNTADPPLLLYAAGAWPSEWPRAIAVVGSRNPTPQGLANARRFARSFAEAGFSVVSGMALGVDGAAHDGALEGAAGGQLATVAVVGTGLDLVYPRQHGELAERIAGRGLVISEYHLGTPPLGANFPKRNRLIAALSEGTVVVEAALRSGSLITARLAAELGKDVFAVPGSIHSPQARGCHALLKEGAKLVETAQDVLEELRAPAAATPGSIAESVRASGHESDEVLAALGFDPVSLDTLVDRTGIAPSQLQAKLLEHELQGNVARLPGGLFQRTGAA
jgi:DNA processing protein